MDPTLRQWVEKWIFDLQLADNQKRRVLMPDGSWARVDSGAGPSPAKDSVADPSVLVMTAVPNVNAQEVCIQSLVKKKEDFVNRPADVDGPTATLKKLVKAATKRLV